MSPMNNLKEKKLNNKGFSLVELIIVIAIMAVLIGVLAPQYLKYVEKSRVSADADQIDTLIYSAENGVVTGTITISTAGAITASSPVTTALTDAGLSTSTIKVTSKMFKTGATINFDETGVTVTGAGKTDIAAALGRKEGA